MLVKSISLLSFPIGCLTLTGCCDCAIPWWYWLSCASYSLWVFSLLRFNVFAHTFQIAVVSCSVFQLAQIRIDFYPIPLADHGACLCICECYMKTVIVFFYTLIGIYGILIFDASW